MLISATFGCGYVMNDIVERVEKLERDAVECDLVAQLAVNTEKKAAFVTLAHEYRVMAARLRKIVLDSPTSPLAPG